MVNFKKDSITIYNKYYDSINDIYKYQRTILEGVNWQSELVSTVGDKGVNVANIARIFIDKLESYVSLKEFEAMGPIQRSGVFTLATNDVIVKEPIYDEITGVRPYRLADIQANNEAITILGVSEFSNHFEVTGK